MKAKKITLKIAKPAPDNEVEEGYDYIITGYEDGGMMYQHLVQHSKELQAMGFEDIMEGAMGYYGPYNEETLKDHLEELEYKVVIIK